MVLIIGGAYQGQLEYAKLHYGEEAWVDGSKCTMEELLLAKGVYDFQEFIKRQIQEQGAVTSLPIELHEKNPNLIIVSNEVGYGVVPVDAFERSYREAVGRVCTKLAAGSSRVVRVICGIGTVLKDV